MLTDMHMHTTRSDGTLSPAELVESAYRNGLKIIAITDHDVVDAYEEAVQYAQEHNIPLQIIPAVEFNTDDPNREVHILGYNINVHCPKLLEILVTLRQAREERIHKILDKLHALGYPVTMAEIAEQTTDTLALGRPHVARVLVKHNYFESIPQAFDTLLSRGKPAYVPHVKISVATAVNLILEMGGFPVLAHPGLIKDDEHVHKLLTDYPFKGVEVYYPKHTPEQICKYLQMTQELGLFATGGSDFHGTPKRYPEKLGLFAFSYKQNEALISRCLGGN